MRSKIVCCYGALSSARLSGGGGLFGHVRTTFGFCSGKIYWYGAGTEILGESDNPETFADLVARKILRNQNLALLFFGRLVGGSDVRRKPKETRSERFA